MCLFRRYSKLHTTCVSYTAVNSSAWSRLDVLEGKGEGGGRVGECVRHDWLFWTGGSENDISVGRSRERDGLSSFSGV